MRVHVLCSCVLVVLNARQLVQHSPFLKVKFLACSILFIAAVRRQWNFHRASDTDATTFHLAGKQSSVIGKGRVVVAIPLHAVPAIVFQPHGPRRTGGYFATHFPGLLIHVTTTFGFFVAAAT